MQLINNEAKTACEIAELEEDYENAIGQAVLEFISKSDVKVDLVCNHGQTIFHEGVSLKLRAKAFSAQGICENQKKAP